MKGKTSKEAKEIQKIAMDVFGFSLEAKNSDGYDFFDSDRGSISVWSIQKALEMAYQAGAATGKE